METKIALQGHFDAAEKPDEWGIPRSERRAWVEFIRWSYEATVSLAAEQSFEVRSQMALEDLRARTGAVTEEE